MRKPRTALILCVLVVFGMSLGFPAEDLTDTAYDESETLPFEEMSALLNVTAASDAAQTILGLLSSCPLKRRVASVFTPAHVLDADVPVELTQLSALRC